jgi:hypothetical protein
VGCDTELGALAQRLNGLNLSILFINNLKDMDLISAELVK